MYSIPVYKWMLPVAILAAVVMVKGAAVGETANESKAERHETATFAAGCFWGVEYAFSQVPGVKGTRVGFMGGDVKNPSYRRVCVGDTGHAEVVQVKFDPNEISYEKLVRVFFLIHDPTTLNRQGPDVGDQYRSAVFTHGPAQHTTALAVKEDLQKSGKFKRPIVTEVVEAGPFWLAEEYHQDYARKNPGSCHVVDMKKVMEEVNK